MRAVILALLLTSCVATRYEHNPKPPPPTSCLLVLDNKGGFVNGGRCVGKSP